MFQMFLARLSVHIWITSVIWPNFVDGEFFAALVESDLIWYATAHSFSHDIFSAASVAVSLKEFAAAFCLGRYTPPVFSNGGSLIETQFSKNIFYLFSCGRELSTRNRSKHDDSWCFIVHHFHTVLSHVTIANPYAKNIIE
jgi:hypothetical protein